MTARLIMLPDTAAALDRLNDARELDVKKRTEAKRHGHTEKYMEFETRFQTAAVAFVEHLLEGAVYVDPELDPRVAALEDTHA